MNIKLTPRLSAVAEFASEGDFIADIGTDHAYLPIWLCINKGITGALASDVKEGPLEKAQSNISAYNLTDKITTALANGLEGIEKYSPNTVFVCGMGGELIYELLDSNSYIKSNPIKLVLQPMTNQARLRKSLLSGGFRIDEERLVAEGDKIYQIICAYYDGAVRDIDDAVALLGEKNIENNEEIFKLHLERQIATLDKKIAGTKKAGIYDMELISLREKLIGYR